MIDRCLAFLRLKGDRRAVTALEYGLIAGVLATVILVGFDVLSGNLSNEFTSVGNTLADGGPADGQ